MKQPNIEERTIQKILDNKTPIIILGLIILFLAPLLLIPITLLILITLKILKAKEARK